MSVNNCNCKCSCTVAAIIVSLIIGIISAFLQITAVITVTPIFLWVVFGIVTVFLYVLVLAGAFMGQREQSSCRCSSLNALLAGILGTLLFSVILLAVGIIATSIASAILVGITLFFFALVLTSTACFVRYQFNCEA